MISRVLTYIFAVLFVSSLVFMTWSIPLFKKQKPIVHVLLLDASLSMKPQAKFIKEAIEKIPRVMKKEDFFTRGYFADRVVFRDEVLLTVTPNMLQQQLNDWVNNSSPNLVYLDHNVTNIMQSITQSYEKWMREGVVHIILLSDCLENQGQLASYASYAKGKDIALTIIPSIQRPKDVFLKAINIPQQIIAKHNFDIEIVIESTNYLSDIPLFIKLNSQNVFEGNIQLRQGENRFLYSAKVEKNGLYELEANLSYIDAFVENNRLIKQFKTKENNQILVIKDSAASSFLLNFADLKFVTPLEMPKSFEEYAGYSGVVLEDVHWNKLLDTGKIVGLSQYIEKGGKLFVVGGNHSFGFGDYMGTPLEKLLPVKVNPNGLISMLVGVDISGSMEGDVSGMRKIDIAINSLLDISKSLETKDQLGVHLYNKERIAENLWIPLQDTVFFSNVFNEKIKTLPKPIGGTFILPALETLYKNLQASDRLLRVAVLISDGETNEKGFEKIFMQFRDATPPINLICIGANMDENSPLIQDGKKVFGEGWSIININKQGWVNLKECFQEAFQKIATGFSATNEFKIYVNQAHPLSRNIQPFEGALKGTILKTSLKLNASVLLDIDDKLPLVAHHYYGSGEVMSFQSGFYENWAGQWLKSEQGMSFQGMLSSWLQRSENDLTIQIQREGDRQQVVVVSEISQMRDSAFLYLTVGDKNLKCIRDGSSRWLAEVDAKDLLESFSSQPFKIQIELNGKLMIIHTGVMPNILSQEILDLHSKKATADFSSIANQWGVNSKALQPIEIVAYEQAFHMRDFFYFSLAFFLLMLLFRARSH